LVEHDVTHPFEYDFYLNAHSAIQGTARPVHYHVLKDEAQVPVNEFHKMIYQFSYQYMRSTTPVSLCESSPESLEYWLTFQSPRCLLRSLGIQPSSRPRVCSSF
jgi:hypothetical protein